MYLSPTLATILLVSVNDFPFLVKSSFRVYVFPVVSPTLITVNERPNKSSTVTSPLIVFVISIYPVSGAVPFFVLTKSKAFTDVDPSE